MHLQPRPYRALALLLRTDELMAAGMSRRRASIVAFLWLLVYSLKCTYR